MSSELMPADDEVYYLSEFFKVFADSTRIKILFVLREGEKCVNDIAAGLEMSQSSISHQLRVLKNANLVRSRRDGRTSVYYLTDDHVRTILSCGMEHVTE